MEWVSVEDRLPEEDKEAENECSARVLIALIRESSMLGDLAIITGGYYNYLWEHWHTDYDDGRTRGYNITHWAYPPKHPALSPTR